MHFVLSIVMYFCLPFFYCYLYVCSLFLHGRLMGKKPSRLPIKLNKQTNSYKVKTKTKRPGAALCKNCLFSGECNTLIFKLTKLQ